jgi:large subunit ribosomal protein L28
MPGVCAYCDKAPVTGKKYVYRGVAKYKGGIGRKVTGKTKRWFKPNLQQLKVVEANGHVHRAWVCTKCIKSGRVMKAPHQKQLAELRAEKSAMKAKK